MQRREFSALLLLAPLAACGITAAGETPLQMAKDYASTTVAALGAAAQAYLASQPPPPPATAAMVQSVLADLQSLDAALNDATAASDARGIAQQILNGLEKIAPLVMPFLGPAAPFLPIALGVISAFVNALPPPKDATPTPPAALRAKAATFHPTHRR